MHPSPALPSPPGASAALPGSQGSRIWGAAGLVLDGPACDTELDGRTVLAFLIE